VSISANSTTPSSLALQGPLLSATNSTISTTDDAFGVFNGATLSSTTTSPLISISGGSVSAGQAGGNFVVMASGSGLPGTALTLAGPLLLATGTTLSAGDPTKNTNGFVLIFDGSQASSTTSSPFMSFTNSSLDTAGNIVNVRRSTASAPSRLTLAGPLLTATNSTFNHTSLGFGASFSTSPAACCSGFFIGQGSQLTSSTASPLIQLTTSTVTGNDSQSGGPFFQVTDTFGGAPAAELVASSSVALAGPLLSATNSTITSLFDLVEVRRSSLTSTTTSALISLSGGSLTVGGTNVITGSTAFGRIFDVFSANSSGGSALAASATLAGPLLSMTGGATVTTNAPVLSVFNGGTFTSTTTSPLISLNASTLTQTQTSGFGNPMLAVDGLGGPSGTSPATVTLSGQLLSVSNGSQLINQGLLQGRFVDSRNGARIIESHPTSPFVAMSGGTHSVDGELFVLLGRSTNTTTDTDPLITSIQLASITVGLDQPLQRSGSGALLQLSNGATLNTRQAIFLDTALFSASAPVLDLAGSTTSLTTATDAINLNQKAKLTATGPLFRINASTVNVTGSAFRVGAGSGMVVNGDLFAISNAGKLNITNGGALFVSGGSVVNITGALVNFSGTSGNLINITNTNGLNLCVSTCSTIGSPGINVLATNGAVITQTGGPGTTIKNSGLGSISLSSGLVPVIIADGANTKVNLQGN
jgi:hypothetical protein